MIEFLVRITLRLPDDLPAERADELRAAELKRGRELVDAGVIKRIWRVPGTTSNVGIWVAADPTELHAAIAGLPLFPWLTVEVSPLARHPIEDR
jgi:muconolactone D-isomerase